MNFKYLKLVLLLFYAINLSAQNFYIPPEYFNSFFSEHHSKLILGNKAINLVLNVKTGAVDTLLPGYRIMANKYDTLHLIFEKDWKKGIANWAGDIIVEPEYNKIYRAERLGGFTASKNNKVFAIPWNGYSPVEIGNDIEKKFARFVKDKIGVTSTGMKSGAYIINLKGDTLFDYRGKNNAYLREDFPNFLTVSNFNYRGFKILDVNTGEEIVNYPGIKQKTLKVGDHLRIQLDNQHFSYLSPEGNIVLAGSPILIQSKYGYKIYENCDSSQQRYQMLKHEEQEFIPCTNTIFNFLDQPQMIYYSHTTNCYTYLDQEGNIIIDGKDQKFCKHIRRNPNFFLRSADGNNFEVLDTLGNVLFNIKGDGYSFFSSFQCYSFDGENYFSYSNKDSHQISNSKGDVLFQKPRFKFSSAPRLHHHAWIFKNDQSNYEILDNEGNIIEELIDTDIQFKGFPTSIPYLIIRKNKAWGIYDLEAKKMVIEDQTEIKHLEDSYFLIKTSDLKMGVINLP